MKLSRAFGNDAVFWRMSGGLLSSHNLAVFYTPNSTKIEVINVKTMSAYSMILPFEIESVQLCSVNKWLIQDKMQKFYVLQKSSENAACPNILKKIEASNESGNIGVLTGSGKDNLSDSDLSAALNAKISSPNRLLASDFTYASLVVGFPDLECSNEVHVWPRQERMRTSSPPIITEQGQIIRTLSSTRVPTDAIPDDQKNAKFSGYLEVVDPAKHKVRYLPIPE